MPTPSIDLDFGTREERDRQYNARATVADFDACMREYAESSALARQQCVGIHDLRYGMDLLSHRVIKVNGCYAVTGDVFRNAYRDGKLNGTIVLSKTYEFYGRSGHVDTALSDELLSNEATAVAGFVNNVYSVYSRSMLWATVNAVTVFTSIHRLPTINSRPSTNSR